MGVRIEKAESKLYNLMADVDLWHPPPLLDITVVRMHSLFMLQYAHLQLSSPTPIFKPTPPSISDFQK